MTRLWVILLVLGALTGSSMVEAAEPAQKRKVVGSCAFPRTCADYDDSREDAKQKCEALKSVWKVTACPKAKVVATCVNDWSRGSSYTHFYPPTTRAEAKKLCDDGLGDLR